MEEKEKSQLKDKIQEDILGCEKEIERLKEAAKPVAPDNSIGRLTRMEAMQSQKMAVGNLTAAKNRLGRLKSAIERIDSEEFGICIVCGEEIPFKRVLAVPYAIKCVECTV